MQKLKYFLKNLYVSKYFKQKLGQNLHSLTVLEMIIYFLFIRLFWSKERRFFFEGSLPLLGQMYIADRKALYDAIREAKPRHCFEIGTYTGGGSTYFIAKAFEDNGEGKLITMESLPYYYNKAKDYFEKRLPGLNKYVEFILSDKASAFDSYIPEGGIDCVFLDGAEDAKESLDQFNYFLPHFHSGTVIMMHDWNTEKMALLKPLIASNSRFQIVKEITPPDSVGFAIAKML
jgi:predicted O-methyltransferase YrrM